MVFSPLVAVVALAVAALCVAQPMPGSRAPGTGVVSGSTGPGTMAATSFSSFYSSQKRILVTGGAGFVGSHLVDRLMEAGHFVIVADNFFTGSKYTLTRWLNHPRFELIRHDITEPLLLEVDQIYHLACPASPVHYKYNPVKTIKTSVMGTINMLGLAKRTRARILLASTSEVYGDPLEHPQKEDYWGNVNPIGVRSCYDEGKRVAETLMFDYHRQHGVEIRVARIFNTYGPRMSFDDGRVVSNFVTQALRGESLTVYKPGTQTRSFCFVSDLVDGLIKLMEGEDTDKVVHWDNGASGVYEDEANYSDLDFVNMKFNHKSGQFVLDWSGPINLGNPGEFTIMELAEIVKETVNPNVEIVYRNNTPDDPQQRRPDITKAKGVLGWEPKIPLREGIPLMAAEFRERLGLEEAHLPLKTPTHTQDEL